ncbi:hypothetical protein IKQ19_09550 [Candidatus Saccharibacteria bacterium]|nr:hypothetical protein [Candidatus Saccharibacteria bacterium]
MFAESTIPDIHYIVKYNKSVNWKKTLLREKALFMDRISAIKMGLKI